MALVEIDIDKKGIIVYGAKINNLRFADITLLAKSV